MEKKKRYPLGTFMKEFGTEGKCREYLAKLRWPDGFVCPKCGCRHAHVRCFGKLFNRGPLDVLRDLYLGITGIPPLI